MNRSQFAEPEPYDHDSQGAADERERQAEREAERAREAERNWHAADPEPPTPPPSTSWAYTCQCAGVEYGSHSNRKICGNCLKQIRRHRRNPPPAPSPELVEVRTLPNDKQPAAPAAIAATAAPELPGLDTQIESLMRAHSLGAILDAAWAADRRIHPQLSRGAE